MKPRKSETIRFVVAWIVDGTVYFQTYKHSANAVKRHQHLITHEGIKPEAARIVIIQ